MRDFAGRGRGRVKVQRQHIPRNVGVKFADAIEILAEGVLIDVRTRLLRLALSLRTCDGAPQFECVIMRRVEYGVDLILRVSVHYNVLYAY